MTIHRYTLQDRLLLPFFTLLLLLPAVRQSLRLELNRRLACPGDEQRIVDNHQCQRYQTLEEECVPREHLLIKPSAIADDPSRETALNLDYVPVLVIPDLDVRIGAVGQRHGKVNSTDDAYNCQHHAQIELHVAAVLLLPHGVCDYEVSID